jgi:ubiquinol-cytochrome c reductase cytochrome c subunit
VNEHPVDGRPVTSPSADPDQRSAAPAARLADRRRHPVASLLLLVVGLTLTGGLYAAMSAAGSATASSSDGDPTQITKGRQLFLEGCSSCHGLNAQGGIVGSASGAVSTGPSLIGVGAAAVDFQVGTGRMPLAAPGVEAVRKQVIYSQNEIDALAAYVASLAPGPAVPSTADLDTTGVNVQQGGEIWRTNCAQCHNFSGAGGALGGGMFAPSLRDSTPKQMWEAMLTGPESMPVFSNNTITPDQKRQVIAYIEALKAQPNPGGMALGRVGPVSEGLFLWLVGLGSVLVVAVWIGAKSS